MVLEKTLESPLDCKEIQPVHSEGDQPWDFFGKNDTKAETPVLWPPHAKSWLIGKDSDAGRDWGQKEKGMTEDEMAGWHHWLDGRESEWTPGVGDGQGSLACCDSWGRKESDTTERLNWPELKDYFPFTKYWLCSLCCTGYLWVCLTPTLFCVTFLFKVSLNSVNPVSNVSHILKENIMRSDNQCSYLLCHTSLRKGLSLQMANKYMKYMKYIACY